MTGTATAAGIEVPIASSANTPTIAFHRPPFGNLLIDNDEDDDDNDPGDKAQMQAQTQRRMSKSLMSASKRRRRRSSARFLRLAGTQLEDDDDEDDEGANERNNHSAQQDLGEMYKKAIKLNAENKLNSKNSWGLRLIENLDKFLEDDENTSMDQENKEKRVNFTKASCTLDASVKIYSYRVDDVHLTSYKVLANLNRNDESKKKTTKLGVDHANDNEGEQDSKMSTSTARRSAGNTETIETNLANINLNKLDYAFDIDPLFHKMSKTFDEGGAKGLLLANLGVGQHGCNIVFDSKEAEDDRKPQDDQQFQETGLIDISSLTAKLDSILGGDLLANVQFVPQLRTLRDELQILNKEGYVDTTAPKRGRRYAISHQDEKEAEMSIHQEAMERSRASVGTLAMSSAQSADTDMDEQEYGDDDFGGGDDDDDLGFNDFIAADQNGDRYSSISFQNEPFVDDSIPGVSPISSTALLDALCSGDALSGNDYEFFSQATLEKLSQGNDWAGSQHWKKTEHMRRRRVQAPVTTKPARKKVSKERIFINLSTKLPLDDILVPIEKSKRGVDPAQLSKAMITKYSKSFNVLPPDSGVGINDLSKLFLRPNDAVRGHGDASCRGGKTVGFHNSVHTIGGGFDGGDDWGGGDDDDGPGFMLADAQDDFVVQELEGVRKVQKTRVGFATVATIVDVKRLKKDLWCELEATLVPTMNDDDTCPEEVEPKALSFNNTVMDMTASQSQTDVTLPFYFICLLHLANEKGLCLESQGLDDFFIFVDNGAKPTIGTVPI